MNGDPNCSEGMEAQTAASIVEMLHAVERTLEAFKEGEHLSEREAAHIATAQRHIDAALREWTARVIAVVPTPTADDETEAIDSEPSARPERGWGAINDMLRIYGERVEARDFTPAQQRRLLVAAFNLSIVAQELMTSVH